MKEPIVRATKIQIEEFQDSPLWKDIKRELGQWKTACKHEYGQVVGEAIESDSSSSRVFMHLGSLYGREMTVDFLLQLPTMFLQILEDKKDDLERERTD